MTKKNIGIVGLGYVGLPLAIEFGKKYDTIGLDINSDRIIQLQAGFDKTGEVRADQFSASTRLKLTSNIEDLRDVNIYIITVPTPIDDGNNPDLDPLKKASIMVGSLLSKGDIVIYESTVYPGCTEEICVPILEESSNMVYNKEFFCGYSPERINPGDTEHTLTSITKLTSGSTPDTASKIDMLYASIIDAGTYPVSSIRVAEAAKVIENTQRDINIAFVNELSLIFNKMDMNTLEVLDAASTKWNFLNFKPGLVGGHCIGVDPYYLTHKSEELGHHPEIILSGRRLNDNMGNYITDRVVKGLIEKQKVPNECKILILGLTFKENCPDVRNTKVKDIVDNLKTLGVKLDIHDPRASKEDIQAIFNHNSLDVIDLVKDNPYDAVIIAVNHIEFDCLADGLWINPGQIIFDVKGMLTAEGVMTL